MGAHLTRREPRQLSHELSAVAKTNFANGYLVLVSQVCIQGFQRAVLAVVTGYSCQKLPHVDDEVSVHFSQKYTFGSFIRPGTSW